MTSSVRAVVASIAYALIAAVALLGFYALTPEASRLDLIGRYAPAIVAGVPGILAWLKSRDAAKIGASNAERLNGSLDQRIIDGAHAAVAGYMEGRPKASRATDTPPPANPHDRH